MQDQQDLEQTPQDLKAASERKLALGATMKAVFWSFLGIRKKRDHEHDVAKLNPVHLIIAGVMGAALFVTILILIVKSVVAK
ncbi:MAG: hypothetical protein RL748_1558 [Pseudomonadota bacterium]|jgi:hypothetical protein